MRGSDRSDLRKTSEVRLTLYWVFFSFGQKSFIVVCYYSTSKLKRPLDSVQSEWVLLSGYNVLAGPFIEWNCCQVARWAPPRCSPPPRHCPRPPCSRPCLSWGVRIWQMLLNIGRMSNVEERKVFTGKIMSNNTYDYDERRLWLWWRWWMMILMMMIMLPAVLEPAAACVVYCPTLVLQAITKPESVQHLISFKFNFRHSFSIWLPAELGIWCN